MNISDYQRLALILTRDPDARAEMIYALGAYRSADRADELCAEIERILASEKK